MKSLRLLAAFAAIAACFLPTPTLGREPCIIVTNGTAKAFHHELAHCNGWRHAPFEPDLYPPDEYVHDYDGPLTVIVAGNSRRTRQIAQAGAKIVETNQRVIEACHNLWEKRGVNLVPYASMLNDRTLVVTGCTVR